MLKTSVNDPRALADRAELWLGIAMATKQGGNRAAACRLFADALTWFRSAEQQGPIDAQGKVNKAEAIREAAACAAESR